MGSTKSSSQKTKAGFFARMFGFFRGVGTELKKVSWPTKKELINFEFVVIVFSIIAALIIWVFDLGFRSAITELLKF